MATLWTKVCFTFSAYRHDSIILNWTQSVTDSNIILPTRKFHKIEAKAIIVTPLITTVSSSIGTIVNLYPELNDRQRHMNFLKG